MKGNIASKRIMCEREQSLSKLLEKIVKRIPKTLPSSKSEKKADLSSHAIDYDKSIKDDTLNNILSKKGDKIILGEFKSIFNDCKQVELQN